MFEPTFNFNCFNFDCHLILSRLIKLIHYDQSNVKSNVQFVSSLLRDYNKFKLIYFFHFFKINFNLKLIENL
jgi:hypothetical protein